MSSLWSQRCRRSAVHTESSPLKGLAVHKLHKARNCFTASDSMRIGTIAVRVLILLLALALVLVFPVPVVSVWSVESHGRFSCCGAPASVARHQVIFAATAPLARSFACFVRCHNAKSAYCNSRSANGSGDLLSSRAVQSACSSDCMMPRDTASHATWCTTTWRDDNLEVFWCSTARMGGMTNKSKGVATASRSIEPEESRRQAR